MKLYGIGERGDVKLSQLPGTSLCYFWPFVKEPIDNISTFDPFLN